METRNIGMGIKTPEKADSTQDKKSPFSGNIKIRGRMFTGIVISARMQRTATVEWTRKVKVEKYERYANKRTRVKAHNPDCIKAEEGDIVKIIECRPLSKTKNFVIIEKISKEKRFAQRKEFLEEAKHKQAEKPVEEKDATSQS
jgi:small subunit ribosomal protein S17